ncbi:MAG: DUF167 domain-containing protein [Alphaproteobacteria bacterium]|nr:DUF167 domain-containing protein [Alphaproteobacteria bacterium]
MLDLFDSQPLPTLLHVRVTPKAKAERIKKAVCEDGNPLYKIYVTAAPEDGKANKAVIALLAKTLGIPKSALKITRGLTNRNKTIQLDYRGYSLPKIN